MSVWLVVLHFTVGGVKAAVLPMEHRSAYTAKADCVQAIPTIKRRWERDGLPAPDAVTCEPHNVREPRHASR